MRQLKIQHQITNRESISLEKYLNDISKLSLLTPEQEVELAIRIKSGDQEALEILTKSNLRFVVSVAKQYQNHGLTLSDLINEGNMGLIKAGKKFDETKGFKFISYAVWWIRQSIMQAIVEQSRMVRLPLNKIDSYQKINKILVKFLQENQRDPSAAEIAELAGLKEKDVREILKINARHVSMDAPINADDSESPMIDLITDKNTKDPDLDLINESLRDDVQNALSFLKKREADILRHYFGLEQNRALSLEEIGQKFDLTRERVRQIKERAIRRLRKSSNSKELKHYLGK